MAKTVQNILKGATIQGHTLKLNCGELDRATYQKVDEVLKRLWGKWKGRQKIHQFAYDPTEAVAEYVASGKLPPKNATAYFPTPAEVVADMLYMVDCYPGRILEPSAGQGAIADACKAEWEDAEVDCVECLDMNSAILKRKGYSVTRGDFLEVEPRAEYDLVIMNPPFSVTGDAQAYMTHIYHAFKFLKPNGELVAIIPERWESKAGKKFDDFREFVALHHKSAFKIDRGAFKESGTMIGTQCISLSKDPFRAKPHCGYDSFHEWGYGLAHDGSYGFELSRQKNNTMSKADYVKFVIKHHFEGGMEFLPVSYSEKFEALTDEAIEEDSNA
jgi:predicted RNA methylase